MSLAGGHAYSVRKCRQATRNPGHLRPLPVQRGAHLVARYREDGPGSSTATIDTATKPIMSLEGVELTKNESKSYHTFAEKLGLAMSGSRAPALSLQQQETLTTTLKHGIEKSEKDLVLLEGAIMLAEQLHLQHKSQQSTTTSSSTSSVQSVGVWQPIFASAGGFPRLLYIPVPEYFDLRHATEEKVDIITELGPVTTHFLGQCRWEDEETFWYKIDTLKVKIGGRHVLTLPFPLNNKLKFFYMDNDPATPPAQRLACARSKLGGTMLLAPEPEGAAKYPA